MADNVNFFQEETKVEDTAIEPIVEDKIKVGETEYSQAELDKLVNLGKIGAEAEEKYKTKIDRVWPEYTKATQKIQDLETRLAEREQAKTEQKVATNQPLDPEETKQIARKQGRELGIMFQEDFDNLYVQRRSAEKLLEDTNSVVTDSKALGKPQTTVEALLTHMQETGIKNPTLAYKSMYEPELDKWKEEQTKKARPSGLTTIDSSTAGAKEPKPIVFRGMKQDELGRLVSEALTGS